MHINPTLHCDILFGYILFWKTSKYRYLDKICFFSVFGFLNSFSSLNKHWHLKIYLTTQFKYFFSLWVCAKRPLLTYKTESWQQLVDCRPVTCSAAVQCSAVQCSAVHCSALHCTALHCAVEHSTALYCTALYSTSFHNTVEHWTAVQISAQHTLV